MGPRWPAAEAALENTRLKSKVTFVSSSKPATTVISQTPGKGHDVPLGSTVLLTVARVQLDRRRCPTWSGYSPTQAKGCVGLARH